MRRTTAFSTLIGLLLLPHAAAAQTLAGWAVLPAHTFTQGPTSGQFIGSIASVDVPFVGQQPIQGFSGLIATHDSTLLAISDNGFGSRGNSADFLLRVTRLTPHFLNPSNGELVAGPVDWENAFVLRDPDAKIPFPIVASMSHYPHPTDSVAVDASIRDGRLLTGADFDIESFRRVPDGTFWFGDEFGPFLVHTDSTGRVLEPPVPLPGVFSPESPLLGDAAPRARTSGGFEGMALSHDGTMLLPMLEKSLVGDDPHVLNIYQFDLAQRRYTSDRPLRRYRLESPEHRIGDFTALSERRFLVIERDELQGQEARFKKIFLVDFDQLGPDGSLMKREIVDLLRLPIPNDPTLAKSFTFPFVTIESVEVLDAQTLCIANDNNYPFSIGRHVVSGALDDNEIILVHFDRPLDTLPMTP